VIYNTAKNHTFALHTIVEFVFLRLIPASRVAQHSAYALDTSRASSSRSCIRNGAYDWKARSSDSLGKRITVPFV